MSKKKEAKYPILTKIKGRMVELGFTQKQLSNITNIKLRRLSDILNGYTQAYLDEAFSIAKVLDIETGDVPIFFALGGA